jgi:hypothetical protein
MAFLLGCAVPVIAAAQSPWRLLGNETVVLKKTCISADDVRETAAGVTAWIKDQYVSGQHLADGREFTVARAQMLVDCKARRWKWVRAVAYDRVGSVVFDDSVPSAAFRATEPGTVSADFAHAACKMAQMRQSIASGAL